MKIKSIFFACLLAFSLCSYCQPCLSGGIDISNQSQIDDFPTNFPACTQILGDVKITGINISNLDGLSNLTSIGGTLTIHGTPIQTDLSALNNLDSVGGDILIASNNSLPSLNGLNNLTQAKGHVIISNNGALVSLDGFAKLIVSKTFQIIYNPLLESLGSQGMLENITPDGELFIYKNPKLTSLAGLQNLTQVEGDITISDNESLTSLDSLIHLTSVSKVFTITSNPALTNLSGLNNLTSVGYLEILSNDSLASLNHLSKLEEAKTFSIRENPMLVNLEGLSNLHSISERFEIWQNAYLEKIGAMNFPDTFWGHISIIGNPKLTSLEAFNNLSFINKGITVYNNESLTNLAGLKNLRKSGGLGIGGSPLLENLFDLNQLDSIIGGARVELSFNPSLTSLSGLENLRFISGDLWIYDNPVLSSLSGLENLHHLRKLEIKNNPFLTNLSAIDSVEFAAELDGYWIQIESNPLLSFCGAQSICNRMAIHWGWTIFSDNAEGCNSQGQVLESCGLSYTDDKIEEAEIRIYPNPTSGVFVVELETPKRFKAQVLDGMGRLVEAVELFGGGVVDLSGEPEGVYFVRLLFDEQMVVRKIVKI